MGDDNIAAKELKIAGPSAVPGLTRVIDKSLQDRKYPKQWKKARLKSVFKEVQKLNEVIIDRFPYSVFQVKYLRDK